MSNKSTSAVQVTDELVERAADAIYGTRGVAGRAITMSKREAKATARLVLTAALSHMQPAAEPLLGECATEGCHLPATVHFVRGDVGSVYCAACYLKVQALSQSQPAPQPDPKAEPVSLAMLDDLDTEHARLESVVTSAELAKSSLKNTKDD